MSKKKRRVLFATAALLLCCGIVWVWVAFWAPAAFHYRLFHEVWGHHPAPAEDELARYAASQGTWEVGSCEAEGLPLVPSVVGYRVRIQGDITTTYQSDGTTSTGRFTIVSGTRGSLNQIDAIEGNRRTIGIYEIADDTLRICMRCEKAGGRPTRFYTETGDQTGLTVLRRISEDEEKQGDWTDEPTIEPAPAATEAGNARTDGVLSTKQPPGMRPRVAAKRDSKGSALKVRLLDPVTGEASLEIERLSSPGGRASEQEDVSEEGSANASVNQAGTNPLNHQGADGLLESMKDFSTAGNAGITLRRMASSQEKQLAATGLRLMRQILTDEETLKNIDTRSDAFHQAERNLDMVNEFLEEHRDELRRSGIEGVRALEDAVAAMEKRFVDAMPSIPESEYNEAGYLQKDIPPDESIRWGPATNGMRLGIVCKSPVVLTEGDDPHSARLFVQNVSDQAVRFHVEGYMAEWVQVQVTGAHGAYVRTEPGDIPLDLPAFPTPWRLKPGEKLELCENRLTVVSPKTATEATEVRGPRSALTGARAAPRHFTAKYVVPLNWRRVIRGKNEWSGKLISGSFPIQVVAANDDEDSRQLTEVKGLGKFRLIDLLAASRYNYLRSRHRARSNDNSSAGNN